MKEKVFKFLQSDAGFVFMAGVALTLIALTLSALGVGGCGGTPQQQAKVANDVVQLLVDIVDAECRGPDPGSPIDCEKRVFKRLQFRASGAGGGGAGGGGAGGHGGGK